MIIKENFDKKYILFDPETTKERNFLEKFPGLLREGLYFFSPNSHAIVYNLYSRIRKEIKNIRYTPFVKQLIEEKPPLKELPETFKFLTEPLPHQKLALQYLYTHGSAGLLLQPGLGKTKIILDYIKLLDGKAIIFCPLPLLFVWEEETYKHRNDLSIHLIKSTDWNKEQEKVLASDVVVVNYDKGISLEKNLASIKFDFIGIDEGLIKNYKTERSKSITRLSKQIPNRVVMSGTLVNNSPIDTFCPIRFIQPALIGVGITNFKDYYAITSRSNKNIIIGFKNLPEIKSILQSCCIVMTKEEWLPYLPKKVFHKIYVPLPDEQYKAYNELAHNYLTILKNGIEIEVDNALTLLCKLTQISNGFIYYTDSDESYNELIGENSKSTKRQAYTFEEQPKIDALHNLINDTNRLNNRRAIIWFNMKEEYNILSKYLISNNIKFLSVQGGDKEIGSKVDIFNKDSSYRFIVCQAKSINYGITILGSKSEDSEEVDYLRFRSEVHDEIFYSLNFSLEIFLQQQDRIHRIGQNKECNYWLILGNTKMEKKIADALERKLHLSRELLIDIANLEKEVTG
jgi:SNF2 family DNA or RNA helicase